MINVITKDQLKNNSRAGMGNQGQRDYSATIGAGKASFSIGRNEMGKAENMTDVLGTKTINGMKVPYYTAFRDSKKDHFILTINLTKISTSSICSTKRSIPLRRGSLRGR